VVVYGGAGVVAAKTWWRERKKRENCWLEENNWGADYFFCQLCTQFSSFSSHEIHLYL
jgi:hypothetical protein